jgi:hypothetical protein
MTLKTTLLLCDPTITINTLVSCITGLEERFNHRSLQPPLVLFFPLMPSYVVVPHPWDDGQ